MKEAVDGAIAEARALGHNYVGTEHLLLALTAQQGTGARHVCSRRSAWTRKGDRKPAGSEGRSAVCRERLLRTLKYVEYHYFGVRYWGYQSTP